MYIYICACVYVYVYIYIHYHVYIYIYIHVYIYIYASISPSSSPHCLPFYSITGAPAGFPSSTFDLHQADTNLAPGHQFFIVICESSLGLPGSPEKNCVFLAAGLTLDITGVGKCPMTWEYWTSPYSSHYRLYT